MSLYYLSQKKREGAPEGWKEEREREGRRGKERCREEGGSVCLSRELTVSAECIREEGDRESEQIRESACLLNKREREREKCEHHVH